VGDWPSNFCFLAYCRCEASNHLAALRSNQVARFGVQSPIKKERFARFQLVGLLCGRFGRPDWPGRRQFVACDEYLAAVATRGRARNRATVSKLAPANFGFPGRKAGRPVQTRPTGPGRGLLAVCAADHRALARMRGAPARHIAPIPFGAHKPSGFPLTPKNQAHWASAPLVSHLHAIDLMASLNFANRFRATAKVSTMSSPNRVTVASNGRPVAGDPIVALRTRCRCVTS
jgi:hypothetical protein